MRLLHGGLFLLLWSWVVLAEAGSLRFFGTGAQGSERDVDRVKIRVDPPTAADLGRRTSPSTSGSRLRPLTTAAA